MCPCFQVTRRTSRACSKAHPRTPEASLWLCTRLCSPTLDGTPSTLSRRRSRTQRGEAGRREIKMMAFDCLQFIRFLNTFWDTRADISYFTVIIHFGRTFIIHHCTSCNDFPSLHARNYTHPYYGYTCFGSVSTLTFVSIESRMSLSWGFT